MSTMSLFTVFSFISYSFFFVKHSIGAELEARYPNNCNDLPDGEYTFKLFNTKDNDFPLINGKCHNGYLILDHNYDNQIENYFTSWTHWFQGTYGPTNADNLVNWENWFLPSALTIDDSSIDKYWLTSTDCQSCDPESGFNLFYSTRSAWYMSPVIYGCSNHVKQTAICDYVYPEDENGIGTCAICPNATNSILNHFPQNRILITEENLETLYYKTNIPVYDLAMTGVCPFMIRSVKEQMFADHDVCVTEDTFKPSLGVDGHHCMCYKTNQPTEYYAASTELINERNTNDLLQQEKLTEASVVKTQRSEASIDDVYYLTQEDFKYGTYRIKQAGTYILNENILFDFNAPEDPTDPNQVFNNYKPLSKQSDDYPGAGEYKDTYFLGFFAGISIESDNVIIDLNGFSLGMSEYFYHQQRWFTNIELSKQYFLTGQGIGNFGVDPVFPDNIVIKNGILDLTSHHAIHGNNNRNVQIKDLIIRNFETHGIGINGFENLIIENVNLEHSSNKIYFTGEFAHAVWVLSKLKTAGLEVVGTDREFIKFRKNEEPITLIDIADEIEIKLKYAYDYVINNYRMDSNDDKYEDFQDAIKLFVNDNGGIAYGSTQYGIYLNSYGANLFVYSTTTYEYSGTAILNNIKISNMNHKTKEYIRLYNSYTLNPYVNFFLGAIDARQIIDGMDNKNFDLDKVRIKNTKYSYKGNIMIDAYIALNWISNTWDYMMQVSTQRGELGLFAIESDLTPDNFASGHQSEYPNQWFGLSCNADVMSHTPKGIIGIRLEGVSRSILSNIEISNLYDNTPLGSNLCGPYKAFIKDRTLSKTNGHVKQIAPMQLGFSGNIIQGICLNMATDVELSNIKINNLQSETGDVYGIIAWQQSNIFVTGNIDISNLYAGTGLKKGILTYDDLPNSAPEACSIKMYNAHGLQPSDGYKNSEASQTRLKYAPDINDNNIITSCIDGHAVCMNLNDEERSYRRSITTTEGSDIHYNTPWSDVGNFNSDNSKCINTETFFKGSNDNTFSIFYVTATVLSIAAFIIIITTLYHQSNTNTKSY